MKVLLNEMSSYNNAVHLYGRAMADKWSKYDFSPSKRYVQKMCSLEKEGIPDNEITKIFGAYQENEKFFDVCGLNFNKLSWKQLKDLVLKQTGEYENVFKLPNQFYESEDGLIHNSATDPRNRFF